MRIDRSSVTTGSSWPMSGLAVGETTGIDGARRGAHDRRAERPGARGRRAPADRASAARTTSRPPASSTSQTSIAAPGTNSRASATACQLQRPRPCGDATTTSATTPPTTTATRASAPGGGREPQVAAQVDRALRRWRRCRRRARRSAPSPARPARRRRRHAGRPRAGPAPPTRCPAQSPPAAPLRRGARGRRRGSPDPA